MVVSYEDGEAYAFRRKKARARYHRLGLCFGCAFAGYFFFFFFGFAAAVGSGIDSGGSIVVCPR